MKLYRCPNERCNHVITELQKRHCLNVLEIDFGCPHCSGKDVDAAKISEFIEWTPPELESLREIVKVMSMFDEPMGALSPAQREYVEELNR